MHRLNTGAQIAGILFGLISLAFLTPTIPTGGGRFLLWAALGAVIISAVNLTHSLCAWAELKRRQADELALTAVIDDTIAQVQKVAESGRAAAQTDRIIH